MLNRGVPACEHLRWLMRLRTLGNLEEGSAPFATITKLWPIMSIEELEVGNQVRINFQNGQYGDYAIEHT